MGEGMREGPLLAHRILAQFDLASHFLPSHVNLSLKVSPTMMHTYAAFYPEIRSDPRHLHTSHHSPLSLLLQYSLIPPRQLLYRKMSSAATEGRFQERAKEHDVRTGNIIAAKGA